MGRTLERVSLILDGHPEFLDWIEGELSRGTRKSRRGWAGLPCEVVLRCGILKQLWQSDYRDLEFALLDSASARHFARVDPLRPPRKSALQKTVGAVRAEVWERINRALLEEARGGRVEAGRKARIDGTVTETHIRRPADNQLLRDGVRVLLTRLMRRARKELGDGAFRLHDHNRAAKRRCLEVSNGRGERRVEAYRKLLAVVRATLGYVPGAVEARGAPWAGAWREKVEHHRDLVERVIDQTERRVLGGERVPSREKVVSLFEPHTDIIAKRGRVQYGHKLNLSAGGSGLVLDAVVERGNPADSSRLIPMIERHAELYGEAPAQVACDGGIREQGESQRGEGAGRGGHGVPQEAGSGAAGDGVLGGGVRPAQEVPGRHGGRDLVPEALLRAQAVRLAGTGALPDLRVVGHRHAQPGRSRPEQAETETGVAPEAPGGSKPAGPRRPGALASPQVGKGRAGGAETARQGLPSPDTDRIKGRKPRGTSREPAFMDGN